MEEGLTGTVTSTGLEGAKVVASMKSPDTTSISAVHGCELVIVTVASGHHSSWKR